jgi:hypothetical protein
MTSPRHALTVTSTADLTPDGILGYAKGIAVFIGGILTIVNEQFVPDDWPYKGWLAGAIAICTLIATITIPNPVKPMVVVPPGPDPVVGVVDPPVLPQDGI